MSLQEIRDDIDTIDDVIIKLLEDRFGLVLRLKEFKSSIDDYEREGEILSRIDSEQVKSVYKGIFANSKKLLQE